MRVKKKGRGRPKGSKNKPKPVPPVSQRKIRRSKASPPPPAAAQAKPGRRRGKVKDNVIVVTDKTKALRKAKVVAEKASSPRGKDYTVMAVAEWLSPRVGGHDKEYFQKEARRMNITFEKAVALNLIGLFSLDEPELKKEILDARR